MSHKRIQDWHDLKLESMDLVLCAGESKMSNRIKWFQRLTGAPEVEAEISHLAGISMTGIWDYGIFHPRKPYSKRIAVQESTTLNEWANKSGVQINPFEKWLMNYNGKVYIRKLDFSRTTESSRTDFKFWTKHKDDPYENGIPGYLELILCGLRLHRHVKKLNPNYVPKFTDEPHCTELQVMRMSEHDLWNQKIIVNRMPPWLWVKEIDEMLNVPISEPIRIK